MFRQVQEAYETLSDPIRRREYDERLNHRTFDRDRSEKPDGGQHHDSRSWPPPPPPGSGASSTYPPPPPGYVPGSYPPPPPAPSGAAGSNTPSFFSRHPALSVAVAAFALLVVASSVRSASITIVALLALLVAGIAGLGRHRSNEGEAFRRADMTSVDVMSGASFEKLLLHLFQAKGLRVAHTGRRGDFGADLVLDYPGGRTVVQAKRWSDRVTHEAVQEVVAAKAHYGASGSMVITNSFFTPHAQVLAQSNAVELWDRIRLSQELSEFSGIPAASGASRFGSQLWAGTGVVARSLFAILLAFGATSSKPRRSPRKTSSTRWSSGGRRVRVRSYTRRRTRRR